jgi:hypothetical protein
MALQPFVGPWPLLQFRNHFYTDGRTPWTSDQPVARPLHTHRSVRASEDSSCLRRRDHCNRLNLGICGVETVRLQGSDLRDHSRIWHQHMLLQRNNWDVNVGDDVTFKPFITHHYLINSGRNWWINFRMFQSLMQFISYNGSVACAIHLVWAIWQYVCIHYAPTRPIMQNIKEFHFNQQRYTWQSNRISLLPLLNTKKG